MTGLHRHLVAFVKEPQVGRVKSRLARDIGAVAACRFYRETTRAVLLRLSGQQHWRRWLAVTPDHAGPWPLLWPPQWERIPQGRGDLGRRMDRVAAQLPPGPVVIIGTDIPTIRPEHIEQAFRALGRHDVVLGPAADGGFWLVGFRRRPASPASRAFAGVRWSTPFALADTLGNLGDADVAALETLEDVDDDDALRRWRAAACQQAYLSDVPNRRWRFLNPIS